MSQSESGATDRTGIARRTFLRGVGVTMALPWLESLAGRMGGGALAASTDGAAAVQFAKRFAVMFMGNGVNLPNWWARGEGASLELGKCLEPLEPVKSKVNVINGLFNKDATGHGIHPPMTGNL